MSRIGDAAYRVVLRLFPPAFRMRRGQDMTMHFAQQREALRGRPLALAALWIRVLVDALWHGLGQRTATGVPSVSSFALGEFRLDLVHASRRLRHNLALAASTILVVIGGWAGTAVVITAGGNLLSPTLPLDEPEHLIAIYRSRDPVMPLGAGPAANLSLSDFRAVENSNLVQSVAASVAVPVVLRRADRRMPALGEAVTDAYFETLRFRGLIGRGLAASDDAPSVVVSARLARELFDGLDGVVGSTLWLDERPYSVVGIAPGNFGGLRGPGGSHIQFWISLRDAISNGSLASRRSKFEDPNYGFLATVARTIEIPEAPLRGLANTLEEANPSLGSPREFLTKPFADVTFSPAAHSWIQRITLGVQLGIAALLVLLIVTVLILFAKHAHSLSAEITMRTTLGATSFQAVALSARQIAILFLVAAPFAYGGYGAVLIGLANRFGGALLGWWGLRPESGVFAISVTPFLLAAICGALPATLQAARRLQPFWRHELAARSASAAAIWLSISIGLSLVLGVVSVALNRQLQALPSMAPNYDWQSLRADAVGVTRSVGLKRVSWTDIESQLKNLEPTAMQVGWIEDLGPAGSAEIPRGGYASIWKAGNGSGMARVPLRLIGVSCGLMEALPIRVSRGRLLSIAECEGKTRGALVPESTARLWWGAVNPVGERFLMNDEEWTVVGIAEDWVTHASAWWRESPPVLVSIDYRSPSGAFLVTRTRTGTGAPLPAVVARALPSFMSVGAGGSVSKSAEQPFLVFAVVRRLFLLLACMSFGLALIGAFAMVAGDLAARRREFGIRLAVGATPLGILKTLLATYVRVAIMTSLVTALSFLWLRALISRFVGAILLGWPAEQLGSWTWIAGGLGMLAVFATALMAFAGRQTGRLNPVVLLREE